MTKAISTKKVSTKKKVNPKKAKTSKQRIFDIADKLLDRIEEASKQLDTNILKTKTKTKLIEYDEDSGKVIHEAITEDEGIAFKKGLVQQSELKTLVTTLKELSDIYSVSSNEQSEGQLQSLIQGLMSHEQ